MRGSPSRAAGCAGNLFSGSSASVNNDHFTFSCLGWFGLVLGEIWPKDPFKTIRPVQIWPPLPGRSGPFPKIWFRRTGVGPRLWRKWDVCFRTVFDVPDVSTHLLFLLSNFGRLWALGVDSGPRGGAFEGMLDPPKQFKDIYFYWRPNGAYVEGTHIDTAPA